VLFLVSHAPGRLLPTIRSRCRRLAFPGWSEGQLSAFVADRIGASEADANLLAAMARGAPGRALALAAEGALEVDRTAHALLRSLPDGDETAQLALAESFRGAEGAKRFELLFGRLSDQVRQMATREAALGRLDGLDLWGAAWERLQVLPAQVEGLNLDRAEAFWTAMADLRRAARA
jgi:DNA polymerase-3 subunit delta'